MPTPQRGVCRANDARERWKRIPLSAQLLGDMVYAKSTSEKSAKMITDQDKAAVLTTQVL
ncbi:Photosystem II stability/assembly factor [Nymphaea thermarum]|nr:Photosystem II stability/assembly factor [Nymphaea thermarum]